MNEPESPPEESRGSDFTSILRWILIVAVLFAGVALMMNHFARTVPVQSPITEPIANAAYPPPDFRLATVDGKELGPHDFLGQVVVIDVWASWCGPCVLQARFLEQLQEEFDGAGVQLLALNAGEDLETVRAYVAKTPFPYPVLLDPSDTISSRYQLMGLPTVMVIDREGQISFIRTGVTDLPTLREKVIEAGAAVPNTAA